MNPVEIIQAHMREELAERRNWDTDAQAQIHAAYRALSREQAEELAHLALELLDTLSVERQYLVHSRLIALALFVPGSLQPLYPELIKRELFYGELYYGADDQTRDQLIARVEESVEHDFALGLILNCLVWIGDEVVQASFARWRDTPPAWWHRPPTSWWPNVPYEPQPLEAYTKEAGWELTRDGKRRDLYPHTWRHLHPVELADSSTVQTAVSGGTLPGEHCPWCGRPLGVLYDLRLSDAELGFLNLPGECLRFLTCEWCCIFAPIYVDAAFSNAAHWSAATERPPYADPGPDQESLGWLEKGYLLGPLESHPLELLTSYHSALDSRLGGPPNWIQGPDYPVCPDCMETMFCIGQINPGDVIYSAPEGLIYLFVCALCGKAASLQQQT